MKQKLCLASYYNFIKTLEIILYQYCNRKCLITLLIETPISINENVYLNQY